MLSWPEKRSALPSLAAALFVSSIWMFVMAGHSAHNNHVTVRHFFVFYLFAVIIIAKSIWVQRVEPTDCA